MPFSLFILVLCHCRTPFAPPALIIGWCPCLAILPLPCHFCCDAIAALPLPCQCWSGAILPLPLLCWRYCCICTAATTTADAKCLSPCHCCKNTSLALEASSLAILANADADIVIESPWLQQRWHQCHFCMFFCRHHHPTPPQSSTVAQCHLLMPPHCRHLPTPLLHRRHLPAPFPSMLIVVFWFYSSKRQGVIHSALWLWI